MGFSQIKVLDPTCRAILEDSSFTQKDSQSEPVYNEPKAIRIHKEYDFFIREGYQMGYEYFANQLNIKWHDYKLSKKPNKVTFDDFANDFKEFWKKNKHLDFENLLKRYSNSQSFFSRTLSSILNYFTEPLPRVTRGGKSRKSRKYKKSKKSKKTKKNKK